MEFTIPVMKQYVQRDEQWVFAARNLAKLQQQRRELEQQEKFWSEMLKGLSKGESSEGGEFRFEKVVRAGLVNYKSIPELGGVDLDQYRGAQVESWKLTIVVKDMNDTNAI